MNDNQNKNDNQQKPESESDDMIPDPSNDQPIETESDQQAETERNASDTNNEFRGTIDDSLLPQNTQASSGEKDPEKTVANLTVEEIRARELMKNATNDDSQEAPSEENSTVDLTNKTVTISEDAPSLSTSESSTVPEVNDDKPKSEAEQTAPPIDAEANLTAEGLSDLTFEFDSSTTMEFGEASNISDEDDDNKTLATEGKTTPEIAENTLQFRDGKNDDQTVGETKADETKEHESTGLTAENISDNTFEFGGEANQTFAFEDGEALSDSGIVDPDENTVDFDDRKRKSGPVEDGDATAEMGKTVPLAKQRSHADLNTDASINRQSESKSISDARVKSLWKNHLDSDVSPSMSIESMRLPKVAEDFSLNPRLVKRNQKPLNTRRKLDYIVGRQLGAGGMGRVQMAHQVAVDRKVAFKEIQPRLIEQYEKNHERPQL